MTRIHPICLLSLASLPSNNWQKFTPEVPLLLPKERSSEEKRELKKGQQTAYSPSRKKAAGIDFHLWDPNPELIIHPFFAVTTLSPAKAPKRKKKKAEFRRKIWTELTWHTCVQINLRTSEWGIIVNANGDIDLKPVRVRVKQHSVLVLETLSFRFRVWLISGHGSDTQRFTWRRVLEEGKRKLLAGDADVEQDQPWGRIVDYDILDG